MRRELCCCRLGDRLRLDLLRLPEVPVGRGGGGGGGGDPVADDGSAARAGRSGRVRGLLVEDDGARAAEKKKGGKSFSSFSFRRHPKV